MKRVSLLIVISTIAMLSAPAHAETVAWATNARASSYYGEGSPDGPASGVLFYLAGPALAAAGVVEPAIGPAAEAALCTVFSMNPCVPEDPSAFAQDTADGAGEAPDRAAGFIAGLPDALASSVTGLPGALAGAQASATGNGNWGSGQATGAPNTYPNCGDIPTAWAPQSSGDAPESITLLYSSPVANAKRIDIYETNVGGFVTSVDVTLSDGSSQTVFAGPDTTTCGGILSIDLSGNPTVLAVTINTAAPGWEEIDAVGIAS
jgi:hypothetical protein